MDELKGPLTRAKTIKFKREINHELRLMADRNYSYPILVGLKNNEYTHHLLNLTYSEANSFLSLLRYHSPGEGRLVSMKKFDKMGYSVLFHAKALVNSFGLTWIELDSFED